MCRSDPKAFYFFESAKDKATGADGVKIAVFRKGRAILEFVWAAAHRRTFG
jgi:hypothetical protein